MSVTSDLVAMRKVGGFTRVYPAGSVPSLPQYPYLVLIYAPDVPVVRTMNAAGDPVRQFTVQHFARTSDGLEDQAAITLATFDGEAIPFTDDDRCELVTSSRPDRDPDDRGVLTTTHVYRF